MTVGERIKKRRLELGLSQDELAARLGLKSKSTVCKMERPGSNPTTETIISYADALGCDPRWLMWGNPLDIEEDITLTDQEREIIIALRQADDQSKRIALFALGVKEGEQEGK